MRRTKSDSATSYEKVESESIDAINQSLVTGIQDVSQCELLAKEVIKSLYEIENRKRPKVVHNGENRALLEKYWKLEYEHRELVDARSAKNDLSRAIEALGDLSLYSATREQLQKRLANTVTGNAQRRVAMRLNQLLKFIGRDLKLRKDKRALSEVRHLTLPEFKRMIRHLDDDFRLLAEVAFYTGARIGEIFALKSSSFKGNLLDISAQIDRAGVRRETKNRVVRKAYVLPEGRARVAEWCSQSARPDRGLRFSEAIRRACAKAFPDDRDKHCVFHDLRHSYAIHLLTKGVSISLVAQSLGNSVTVCQQHYVGFTLSSDSINAIESIMIR